MNYNLPIAVEVNGRSYRIRNKGDYRAVLDTIAALNDPNLTEQQRGYCACFIFFEDLEKIREEDVDGAVEGMLNFISGGRSDERIETPKVMDWEQDFDMLVAPINRVIGKEIRSLDYLHWWSFLSAYYEVGDCAFAQIVSIRNKLARGKKLEQWEREFYNENRSMIDFKTIISDEEQRLLDEIMGVI